MTPKDTMRRYIGLRFGNEAERLMAEAEPLLAAGYSPEELVIVSNVNQQVEPHVVPLSWLDDHGEEGDEFQAKDPDS